MTIKDLELILIKENIPKWHYDFNGGSGNLDDQYVLIKIDNHWEVYYLERGKKENIKEFKTEDEACEYMYKKIISNKPYFK